MGSCELQDPFWKARQPRNQRTIRLVLGPLDSMYPFAHRLKHRARTRSDHRYTSRTRSALPTVAGDRVRIQLKTLAGRGCGAVPNSRIQGSVTRYLQAAVRRASLGIGKLHDPTPLSEPISE